MALNIRSAVAELLAAEVARHNRRGAPPTRVQRIQPFWAEWRKPDSVKALFDARASADGVEIPTGYGEVNALLRGAQ